MKKNQKSFEWNKVTTFSKALAMILFIALPFMGFVLGMKFQKELVNYQNQCMLTNSGNNWRR